MKDKLKDLLKDGCEYWDISDLRDLMNDLESGGDELKEVIYEMIDEIENSETNVCAVCGEKATTNSYILIFGPEDFRKQANFCAIDCMEYFLGKLRSVHNKKEIINKREEEYK